MTKYEVKPAVGVRVNRISNLADDLALALAAKDVRIEAPIPGKSLVGIEVPNSEIATVTFRELWEQSKTDDKKLLEIPLGKAVNGSVRHLIWQRCLICWWQDRLVLENPLQSTALLLVFS